MNIFKENQEKIREIESWNIIYTLTGHVKGS